MRRIVLISIVMLTSCTFDPTGEPMPDNSDPVDGPAPDAGIEPEPDAEPTPPPPPPPPPPEEEEEEDDGPGNSGPGGGGNGDD